MNSQLIREIMRDRPHVLVRGGELPGGTTAAAHDVSRQGRHGDYNGPGHHAFPGPRGLDRMADRLDPTNIMQIPSGNVGAWNGPTTVSLFLKGTYSTTNDTYECVSGDLNRFLNYFNRPTSGRMTCYWGANNEGEALVSASGTPWNDGQWQMWTWIRDTAPATPLLSIYRNGVLNASRNEAGAAPLASSGLRLRSSPTAGQPSIEWTCLAMWSRALSPVRLRAHYRAGMNLLGDRLVGV